MTDNLRSGCFQVQFFSQFTAGLVIRLITCGYVIIPARLNNHSLSATVKIEPVIVIQIATLSMRALVYTVALSYDAPTWALIIGVLVSSSLILQVIFELLDEARCGNNTNVLIQPRGFERFRPRSECPSTVDLQYANAH